MFAPVSVIVLRPFQGIKKKQHALLEANLAVVRGCQAPKRISAKPGGARKRARLGFTERSCTSGLYSGSELRPMFAPSKACGLQRRVGSRRKVKGLARLVQSVRELCRRRQPQRLP